MKHYEVLWYVDHHEYGEVVYTKEFRTKRAALNYYHKHKYDSFKRDWWVTKRADDWSVIEDIDLGD